MSLRILIQSEKMTPEDASSHGEHHAFVFDGLGGAGGKLRTADDGRQASEAKIASNAAAEAMDALLAERWAYWAGTLDFSSQAGLEEQIHTIVEQEIGGKMLSALDKAAKEWNAEDGRFPTTIAGWLTFPAPEGKTLAVAVWAGDSRCYTIDASGMKLYSRDDAPEAYRRDAMEDCIYKDSLRMDNRLGRDMTFTLNYSCHLFEGPILLLSCSDGFYHCAESPMHFEYYLRNLGEYESIEEMQEELRDFILDGRFEDDSATLETIFIHTDPDDVEALRALLKGRLNELKEAYIDPFPNEEERRESYADIEAYVNRMVKNLSAEGGRHHFLEELRTNAVRLAMEDCELPADMPCAQTVRQMRNEYIRQKRERKDKRDVLEGRKSRAENALDERLKKARLWEPKVKMEASKLSPQVEALFSKRRWQKISNRDIFNTMRRRINDLFWYGMYLCSGDARMRSWMELSDKHWYGYDYYPSQIPPPDPNFPKTREEAFQQIQQILVDQCALADKQAELNCTRTGEPKILADTAKPYSESFGLTSEERKQLKEALILAAGDGNLDDDKMGEYLFRMQMNALDLVELFKYAAAYVRACRELDDFDQSKEVLPEPSAQPFDEYLKFHRNSDARYLVERWLETGEKPECFKLSPDLQKRIEDSVRALQEKKANNESIKKAIDELRNQQLDLWRQYRTGFEAHDEPFVFVAAAKPETTGLKEPQFQTCTSQDGRLVFVPQDADEVNTRNDVFVEIFSSDAEDQPVLTEDQSAPAEDRPMSAEDQPVSADDQITPAEDVQDGDEASGSGDSE